MPVSRQELKERAFAAIDQNRDKIIALGDSIFAEPELGFKEVKTAAKIKKVFEELGYEYQDGAAITGVIAPRKGKESKMKVAVMGELDAVVAPGHRCADPKTGAAHSCGHNCMIAALSGVAYALKDTGIMEELSGDIVLMAVPAEESGEIGYRNELKKEGKIYFLGGKPEFIRLGYLDDVDVLLMQHSANYEGEQKRAYAGGETIGFLGKLVHYIGKEAHAGGAPHLGINALNAAQIGLMAVNAQRETFQDKDHIRVHPIMTKGGDLVNVVPADVRIETYVRGGSVEAIFDASAKVDRAFKAGADAVGAKCEITNLPGYLPTDFSKDLYDLNYENLKMIIGEEQAGYQAPLSTASGDLGDVSHIMPCIQASIGGAVGVFHSENFEIGDKELAYIVPAKLLVATAIDLLADGAKTGLAVKANFRPKMTKQEYLTVWGGMKE